MLWFLSIASKRGFRVNGYFDRAVGEMGENDTGRVVITTVRLRPVVDWDAVAPSDAVVAEMHHAAHDQCFIANSVLTNVLIESETN